ncbi:hypothetical protein COHA_004652 [Chlorella ohadii]|uniref:Uncharacterized protein n=1 Tax=Chlorella ohadii TaxID=2649997 RepID=A0AAD5DQ07_9CHLO|nr:hypothetical protein COHA_004652 [Chlorella ohadii]
MCGKKCCPNANDQCYNADGLFGFDSCCPSGSELYPPTGTKQVCCAPGTSGYTTAYGEYKCCDDAKCEVSSGVFQCCDSKQECKDMQLTPNTKKCCGTADIVCGDTCCNQYATCFNSDGEPFPLDSTKKQVCCPAGTEGYMNGQEPACCADDQYDHFHRCCPAGEDLCSTADGEVCCSLAAISAKCQIVGVKGDGDDVCCTDDRWTGTECCVEGVVFPEQPASGIQVCCNKKTQTPYLDKDTGVPKCCPKDRLDVYGRCCDQVSFCTDRPTSSCPVTHPAAAYWASSENKCCDSEHKWAEDENVCCSIFPVDCPGGGKKCCGTAELCQIEDGDPVCCPQGKWTGDDPTSTVKECCQGSTVPVKCKARDGDANPPTICCEEQVDCQYNENKDSDGNIIGYSCTVASCAPIPHCAIGQQTGINTDPPCCCKQCEDGFVPQCNSPSGSLDTGCNEAGGAGCGCTCPGLTCNAGQPNEFCCTTPGDFCYDKDGKPENGDEGCCPPARFTGKPDNQCCSSEASKYVGSYSLELYKCLVGDATYKCCDPWEECKPIKDSPYSVCCTKDQKLCGSECCSQDAKCYYPDGLLKPASCCKAGCESLMIVC